MRAPTYRTGVLGAVSAALLLAGAIPAQAAADAEPQARQEQTKHKVIPYVISDPDLVANPEKVVRELQRSGGSLDALGIAPASSDGPSKVKRSQAMVQAEPESYSVDSSRFPGGALPADIYDYATPVECDNADSAYRDQGWIKNRYSYCQTHLVVMPAVSCSPIGCKLEGVFTSRNRLIGHGKAGGPDGSKLTRWATFDLEVAVLTSTGPFSGAGAEMTAEIQCKGNRHGSDHDGGACHGGADPEVKKPIREWRQDPSASFELRSQASPPSAGNGEQIATGVFHIEYDFRLPWYFQFFDTESPEGGMRFDSAWYLQSHQLGSVFDRAVPGMAYDVSDAAVGGVAQHIDDARTNPGTTMPQQTGKDLAGATPSDPIHRLAPAKGKDQRSRYNDNRRVIRNYRNSAAMQNIKPTTGGPYDCDEYAFASTYEGAARFKYDGTRYQRHFSARWVNRKVNQEAGRRLGRWYDVDRILDNEEFYIPIIKTGP